MWMCEQFALQKRTVETDGLATARGTERGAAQQQLSDDVAGSTTDVASATVKLLLESSWGKKSVQLVEIGQQNLLPDGKIT